MAEIDPTHEDLETLIAKLVSIETENPPGNERPGSEFIRDWFQDQNVDTELVYDPYEDRPQVLADVGTETRQLSSTVT